MKTPNVTAYPLGARVAMKGDIEAQILENEIEHTDYLVIYKRRDGSWSQKNCLHNEITGLWSDLIKIEFKATVQQVTKSTIILELYERAVLDQFEQKLLGKRVNINLIERK